MATVFKASKRAIILENVTHIQVCPTATLVYPAGFYTLRLTGDEAARVVEQARSVGFVGGDELLVNPNRLVLAEEENATARLMMDGFSKQLIVPVGFLGCLEPQPLSSAGNNEPAKAARSRKKSAE